MSHICNFNTVMVVGVLTKTKTKTKAKTKAKTNTKAKTKAKTTANDPLDIVDLKFLHEYFKVLNSLRTEGCKMTYFQSYTCYAYVERLKLLEVAIFT